MLLKTIAIALCCIDLIKLLSLIRTPFAKEKDYCHSIPKVAHLSSFGKCSCNNPTKYFEESCNLVWILHYNYILYQESKSTSSIGIHGPNLVPTQNNLGQIINFF
jgi:hypothetical protein